MNVNFHARLLILLTLLVSVRWCHAQQSPDIHDDGRVTFRFSFPAAEKVLVLGDWFKRGEQLPMARDSEGAWSATAGPFPPGNHIYSFEVDGTSIPDPSNSSVKLRATGAGSFFHIPGDAPWEPKDVPHGNVEINFHQSETLGDTRWFSVYTPPQYHRQSSREYPVLYLLHGSNDTAIGWVMIGAANFILDNLIAEGSASEMIVVMPFGHAVPHGAPRELQRTNTERFEAYLLDDVIPLVESKYRVVKSRDNRALAGLSMGGGQAVTIGLRNLDRFCAIGSFSGAVPAAESDALSEILASATQVNDRLDLFWIGCGEDDFLLDRNRSFSDMLTEKGIEHEFQVTAGVHNYEVWRRYLVTLTKELFKNSQPAPGTTGNAQNVPFIGGRDAAGNPVRLAQRTGHVSNYDESQVPAYSLPDPLAMRDGTLVSTAADWTARRQEILEFFQQQIYGTIPDNAPSVAWQVVGVDENAYDGRAITRQIEGAAGPESDLKLRLTLHLPKESAGPVPVLVNLSFFGGQAPRRPAGGEGEPRFDPITAALDRGWAFAQIGYGDIQPDRPDQWHQGVIGLTLTSDQNRPLSEQWGTISAWAWGTSRVIDYLQTEDQIDPRRIALTGASRLGKTALWAAALDQRISAVMSIVPGSMGAALIRRDWGETLDDMAQNFSWQFAGNLQKWVGRWDELPVDQHLLISLIAPRPVYVNGGVSDQWSDPKGEFLALVAASPAYELLGATGLGSDQLPELDRPLTSGHLAFHYHSQGHRAVPEDWEQFFEFAERHFESPGE